MARSQQAATPAADPAAAQPVFKAQSDLVVLQLNVFDGRSDAVENLPQTAFRIFEDGREQRITFFGADDVPVAAGLVIDNSSSMIARRQMVVSGGTVFAETSHADDELFTIIFNEHVRLGLPGGLAFTKSRPVIEASLRSREAGGQTALYDAVTEALDHVDRSSLQKRVLIVLSDGEDNASRRSRADMFHRAARSDALVYTIWTGDLTSQRGDRGVLRDLAERTGGLLYAPRNDAEVVAAFRQIAANIRRGYSVGYVPTNRASDGEYRRVKALVRVPGRSLTVHARDGYTAVSPQAPGNAPEATLEAQH